MDNEFIRRLIAFDDTDTSSGFVSVGSDGIIQWGDVYEFDEWLQKEFQKYDILYENCTEVFWESQDIECNFSFCEGDILGFGIVPDADEEYGDDIDIENDLDIRVRGFLDFCDNGAFIYLEYVNFGGEHDYFENEPELKVYQQKIKNVLPKIRDRIWSVYRNMRNINESAYNLITFDEGDTSSGFVNVGSGNTFQWNDVYEFDEWLEKEFEKYGIYYDSSYNIEQNYFGFSFCDEDIEGTGTSDVDFDVVEDIVDDLQARIDAFYNFCDTGDFTYLDPVGKFADNFKNFTNEREYKAYQNKIIKAARKIQDKIKPLNESVQNIITFDEGDVSTGFNSVSGPMEKQRLFWDADYATGFGNPHSFVWLTHTCFSNRITLDRKKGGMDFVITIHKPITVMARPTLDEPYKDIKLEFYANIAFSGELVDGVYPVLWYDDVVNAVEDWKPDRKTIRSWPAGVDVYKTEWIYKVIPAFEKDKTKLLNIIEKRMKPGCESNIEEYFEGDGK